MVILFKVTTEFCLNVEALVGLGFARSIAFRMMLLRLDPEKNMKFLIETIPLVLREIDMQLIIVGTGVEGQRLKNLVRLLKFVTSI